MIHDLDPVRAVADALRRAATAAGHGIAITAGDATPWWSATFAGHRMWLAVEGPSIDGWLATLPEADLVVPGLLVADCTVDAGDAGSGPSIVSLLVLDVEPAAD